MQNVTMKLDAATVQRIVENHINGVLDLNSVARVTQLASSAPVEFRSNQPNLELIATFDIQTERGAAINRK